jgi:hypothetical protein
MSQSVQSEVIGASSAPAWKVWTGRVLTTLPVLMFAMSAAMKLSHAPQIVDSFVNHFGFHEGALLGIGLLEIACVVVYLVPRTAVLGAVLLTGYLGGAVVTHLRVGEPFVVPLLLGVMLWGGVWLREPRLQALVPLRR